MRPDKLLPWLLGAAIGAAGLIQGLHWRATAPVADDEEREGTIVALQNEVALLKRENESLRSLAQGGGEIAVDPETIQFVESALGLDFRSNPQIHRIAAEELRDRIVASIESRYGPHGLDSRQKAWILMGLLGPDDLFAPQFAATKSVGARSWFDEQSGDGWVTDRFDPQSIPDQAALIRALVRILIHQNYPPAPGWSGDDAAAARQALHHGTAMAVEGRFLARQALGIGFTGIQENTDARELLAHLPPFISGLATFPSALGLPRAERLMDQEEILSALHRPPALSADYFPDHEGITAEPPMLPETPGNALLDESIGMLGVKLWLQALGDEFTPLAEGWRGDRYRLFASSDSDTHLIWDIRFDSTESANAFSAAAADLISALAGTDEAPQVGVITATPDERFVVLSRPAPEIVRFLNTADRRTAETLAR